MNDWHDALMNLRESGELAPDQTPEATDDGAKEQAKPRKACRLDIVLDRKRRGGKLSTIIVGFPDDMPTDEIDELGSELRRKLSTGGSARGGEILLQGDCRQAAARFLQERGYKCRMI